MKTDIILVCYYRTTVGSLCTSTIACCVNKSQCFVSQIQPFSTIINWLHSIAQIIYLTGQNRTVDRLRTCTWPGITKNVILFIECSVTSVYRFRVQLFVGGRSFVARQAFGNCRLFPSLFTKNTRVLQKAREYMRKKTTKVQKLQKINIFLK